MPHPRAHREVEPRRRVGLVVLIVAPALDAAVRPQTARVPSPRAHLSKDARRRIALSIIVHPPARDRATLAHRARMRRPRAHLRKDSLRRSSPPKAAAPPTGNLPRFPQPASMQIPRANRAESPLRRLRLSVIEHAAPKTPGPPARDRAATLAHRAGEMPAHSNIPERAVRRVRISTPADNPAILPPNRAVVPLPRADSRVAPLRNLKQLRLPTAPAMNATGDVEGASVVAPSIKRDVAVHRSVRGQSVGDAESQKREQQRRKRPVRGLPPPPPAGARAPPRGRRVERRSAGRRRVSRLPLYTHAPPSSYPRSAAGISPSSAPKPLPRRRRTFSARRSRGLPRRFLPAQE